MEHANRQQSLGSVAAKIGASLNSAAERLADAPISALIEDSRAACPGALYFALPGAKADGHDFIDAAFSKGILAAVVDAGSSRAAAFTGYDRPLLTVGNGRRALALAADLMAGSPAASLETYGVTGTNGKTSVTWLIANLLSALGSGSGIVGTLGTVALKPKAGSDQPAFRETSNTCPGPLVIQPFLQGLVRDGYRAAAIEATSQGISQHRTDGIDWSCAVFTNLTRDHLDLHGTIENYGNLKRKLFTEQLAVSKIAHKAAVIFTDDPFGKELHSQLVAEHPQIRAVEYSLERKTDCHVVESICGLDRTEIKVRMFGEEANLRTQLLGRYNVANVVGAVAALVAMGHELQAVAEALPGVMPVPGRLEPVRPSGAPGAITVFVDYAHTPDALENVQRSLRELARGRLITVFGCGGDRDRGKRPLMGKAVAELSDIAVVTSDNPRTEDPEAIISEIIPGLEQGRSNADFAWFQYVSRDEAIAAAIDLARPGDVVLVAGKGHEDYQEIQGIKHPFHDVAVCRKVLDSAAG